MPRPQNWHHLETGEQPARSSTLPPPRPLARLLLPLPTGPSARPGNGAGVAGGWRRGGTRGAGARWGPRGQAGGWAGACAPWARGARSPARGLTPGCAGSERRKRRKTRRVWGALKEGQSPEGAHPRRGAALCVHTLAPRAAAASRLSQRSPSGFLPAFLA